MLQPSQQTSFSCHKYVSTQYIYFFATAEELTTEQHAQMLLMQMYPRPRMHSDGHPCVHNFPLLAIAISQDYS